MENDTEMLSCLGVFLFQKNVQITKASPMCTDSSSVGIQV